VLLLCLISINLVILRTNNANLSGVNGLIQQNRQLQKSKEDLPPSYSQTQSQQFEQTPPQYGRQQIPNISANIV
jgi:hypothetical protein